LLPEEHIWVVNVISKTKEWTDGKGNWEYPDESHEHHTGLGNRTIVRQRRFEYGLVSLIRHGYQMKNCVQVKVPHKERIEETHCLAV